jgi:hypothetical protein
VADPNPLFPPEAPFTTLLDTTYGTLDNLEFLTSDLTQFGPAGDQLVARFEQLIADLQAAHPGVTFIVSPITSTFLGIRSYELLGGTSSDLSPSGETVTVTGTANVDFFTVEATIEVEGPGCRADTDDDGLPDDQDACPTSDVSSTVVLDGCRTGVDNVLDGEGCTIADRLDDCAAGARNHLHYVACVTTRALRFKAQGLTTLKDKVKLVVCAAKADIPAGRQLPGRWPGGQAPGAWGGRDVVRPAEVVARQAGRWPGETPGGAPGALSPVIGVRGGWTLHR